MYAYIYIYCEQNYPCSGYVVWLIVSEVLRTVSSVSIVHCRGARSFQCLNGVLSQRGVGEQSLEILQGVLTLYPRRVPICTPHVRCDLISPNTKDGNL